MHHMLNGLAKLYRRWQNVKEALVPPAVSRPPPGKNDLLRARRVTTQGGPS